MTDTGARSPEPHQSSQDEGRLDSSSLHFKPLTALHLGWAPSTRPPLEEGVLDSCVCTDGGPVEVRTDYRHNVQYPRMMQR